MLTNCRNITRTPLKIYTQSPVLWDHIWSTQLKLGNFSSDQAGVNFSNHSKPTYGKFRMFCRVFFLTLPLSKITLQELLSLVKFCKYIQMHWTEKKSCISNLAHFCWSSKLTLNPQQQYYPKLHLIYAGNCQPSLDIWSSYDKKFDVIIFYVQSWKV